VWDDCCIRKITWTKSKCAQVELISLISIYNVSSCKITVKTVKTNYPTISKLFDNESDPIEAIDDVEKSFGTLRDQIESNIQFKLKNVIEKICGLSRLNKSSYVITGTEDIEKLNDFLEEIFNCDILYFK